MDEVVRGAEWTERAGRIARVFALQGSAERSTARSAALAA